MPNRIIKESICTSDTIDMLSAEEERLFYRLMVQADDFGRFDGRSPIVLAACFPLRTHEIGTDQVEAWLQKLATVDLIRFYFVDGRRYIYFTTWDKHQQKRAKHSKYPDPDSDGSHSESVSHHLISDDIRRHATDSKCPRESRNEKREYENRETTDHAREREETPTGEPSLQGRSVGPSESASLSDVCRHYERRIGIMGPSVYHKLQGWHEDHGMEPALLIAAIDVTLQAKADRRIRGSPDNYLDGVLRGMHNDGIRTVEQLRERDGPQTVEETEEYLLGLLRQTEEASL